ncbi:hypothetical protein [Rhizobium sp. R635]|uniref:hypothetical protein n=1 Tax=unclassified Rhizobium TaxID=2613769 RepID=UPI000B52D2BF|nr:hypothetical protein [Rhizobium sp. R635]
MLLNWVVLFNELQKHNRPVRHDPFADPLDGPEWRGFLWLVPVLARLTARPYVDTEASRCDEPRIEKSLRFRSSAAIRGAEIPD